MGVKEERIKSIVRLYYSNPKVQQTIVGFSKNRETVPSYMGEAYGKRPDIIQYPSDIMGLVNKGASSFHTSEELWEEPLQLSSEITREEMNRLRKGWDLLIDIDSQYLDCSKIAAILLIKALEKHKIKNYGIKFSVTGNTSVLIKNNGNVRLTNIKEAVEELKNGEKLKILSLNKSKNIVFSKIYNWLEHEDRIYEIKHEQSKIPLKATGHHSVFVFDKGKIRQKKVSGIKEGDFLITFNSSLQNHISNSRSISYEYEFNKKRIKKKVKITKGLMRLIGYYLAEGHVTNVINQIGFAFNRNEIMYIDDCVNLLKKITSKPVSIRHPNESSTQILIHSKEWASFFETFCGKARKKHVPQFSWKVNSNLFLEMLLGYIRGDGYKVGKYEIAIKSVALQLIKEFVWLCKLHGISCSLSNEHNKPHRLPQGNVFKGSFVYILKIPKSEIKIDEFSRERNKFSPHPRDRTFPVDGLKQVYHEIKPGQFNNHRAEQMTLSKKRANLSRIKKVIDWFKKFNSRGLSDKSKKIIKNYESLFGSDVGVVEIKTIKKLRKKEIVYDVSIRDTEAFFGNDYPVLLHNSGSKGFHVIVGNNAFPDEYNGMKKNEMFPEWPRIICSYLKECIKKEYNKEVSELGINFEALETRTSLKREDITSIVCPVCGKEAKKGNIIKFVCPVCGDSIERKNIKPSKRRLRCTNNNCAGVLEIAEKKELFYCENCNTSSWDKIGKSRHKIVGEIEEKKDEFEEEISGETLGGLDLVLVAPRHLFRAPYSLHEKTSFASIVINKENIKDFDPRSANPLKVEVKEFLPNNIKNEAEFLLDSALSWNEKRKGLEKEHEKEKYKKYDKVKFENVTEEMFPPAIKKLLMGLKDGKKRGLFILLTFLKMIGFGGGKIVEIIHEWNKKNEPPLREGYIKSQIDWHLRQKKQIMPPNYNNDMFYKDLQLLDKPPKSKNPVVDVMREIRKNTTKDNNP